MGLVAQCFSQGKGLVACGKKVPAKIEERNAETLRTQRRSKLNRSGAYGGAEGVGEGFAVTLDVGFMFGFDHDAGELLGTRVAEDDAAIVAERRLRFG